MQSEYLRTIATNSNRALGCGKPLDLRVNRYGQSRPTIYGDPVIHRNDLSNLSNSGNFQNAQSSTYPNKSGMFEQLSSSVASNVNLQSNFSHLNPLLNPYYQLQLQALILQQMNVSETVLPTNKPAAGVSGLQESQLSSNSLETNYQPITSLQKPRQNTGQYLTHLENSKIPEREVFEKNGKAVISGNSTTNDHADNQENTFESLSSTSDEASNLKVVEHESLKTFRPFKSYFSKHKLVEDNPKAEEENPTFKEKVLKPTDDSGKNSHSSLSDKSDPDYLEKRRKNNIAAKRSRDARKRKEDELATRTMLLERENVGLKLQIEATKNEINTLKGLIRVHSQNIGYNVRQENRAINQFVME